MDARIIIYEKKEMDQNSRQHTPQDLPSKQTITVIPCGCVDIFWGHHVWPIPKHCQMKGFVWKYFASIIRWWWFVFMFAIENASNCYIPVIYPPFSHTHTKSKLSKCQVAALFRTRPWIRMMGLHGFSFSTVPVSPGHSLSVCEQNVGFTMGERPQQMRRLDLWPVKNPLAASAFWSILYC